MEAGHITILRTSILIIRGWIHMLLNVVVNGSSAFRLSSRVRSKISRDRRIRATSTKPDNWSEIRRADGEGRRSVPRVLIIAGSDSGGGAGIQADIKTCMATGSFATTAITAVTSQNTCGVQKIHPIPINDIQSQIDSVITDIGVDAVKIGMLPSVDVVEVIAEKMDAYGRPPLIVDPVLVSTSGHHLSSQSVKEAIVQHLFPLSTVVCPNIPEAAAITGIVIESIEDMKQAAERLLQEGPRIVLLKGGHLKDQSGMVHDVVCSTEGAARVLSHPRVETERLHGTGCSVASAIASAIAQGYSEIEAIGFSIRYVSSALERSQLMDIGTGSQLPFNHGYQWKQWPSRQPLRHPLDIRVYAITDSRLNSKHQRDIAGAVENAIIGGATVVQIREKNVEGGQFLQNVKEAIEVARQYSIPVIVNDRVDVALAADADGVHLGQGDLPTDVARRMIGHEKILGVSAKSVEDVEQASRGGADYVGVGSIFTTSSKDTKVIGIDQLRDICDATSFPIVAVGGIDADNATSVIEAGADGVAVISAIFDSDGIRSAAAQLRTTVDLAIDRRSQKHE